MGEDERKRRFGRRLRELRKAAGLEQGELAGRLQAEGHDVKPSTLSGWERGTAIPRNRRSIVALELLLGDADSTLSKALGLPIRPEVVARVEHRPPLDVYDRLDAIAAKLDELFAKLDESASRAQELTDAAEREAVAHPRSAGSGG